MTKRTTTKGCLELVHTNMHRTFNVHAWGGYGYFITFSDDYSWFGYVHRKSNALDTFIEFKARSNNLLGMPSHFDYLKVICLVSLIPFIGACDYFLVMCTKVSIAR